MSRPILHGILKSILPHCSQQAGTCEVAEFLCWDISTRTPMALPRHRQLTSRKPRQTVGFG
jgi:hypothetical protein